MNAAAGSAAEASAALDAAAAFAVERLEPAQLGERLRKAVERGEQRVLVAGGDGTIAAAAAALVGTPTLLCVLPGGTLNHFARDHGIPLEPEAACSAAASAPARSIDVGWVNDRLFLNTSSVGAYVTFVRTRERLERSFGYRLASLLAAVRLLGRIRPFHVELEVDGQVLRRRSALVFIAVGERELRAPIVGGRIPAGARQLHVMVVRGGTTARLLALGLEALARGVWRAARGPYLDSFLADRLTIEMPRPWGTVAVDGELVRMKAPLHYRIQRDALQVAVPPTEEPAG